MNFWSKYRVWLMLLVVCIFTYWLVGENLKAKLWIIDDHEIVAMLGNDLNIDANEIVPTILNTEAGKPGISRRYRPLYYSLRTIEAYLWGNNPFLWYFFRIIVFGLFMLFSWYILEKYLGFVIGFLVTLNILKFHFWPDIFIRLGPAEIYVLLGLMIFILGFYNILKEERTKNNFNWFLVMLGTIISAGSKENMIVIIMPLIYLFSISVKQKKVNLIVILMFGFSFIFCVFMVGSIYLAMKTYGQDIYSQSVNFASRFALVKGGLKNVLGEIYLPIASSFLIGLYFYFWNKKNYTNYIILEFRYLFYYFISILFFLTQYVFYNGLWPKGNRYDFPGVLIYPFLFVISLLFVNKVLSVLKIKYFQRVVSIVAVCLLIFNIQKGGFKILTRAVKENVERTSKFTDKLSNVVEFAKEREDLPIVFYSYGLYDYEPLGSMVKFLRSYGINNSMYIKAFVCDKNFRKNSWEIYLSNSICDWSKNGTADGFSPISNMKSNEFICLGFSGDVHDTGCVFSDEITGLGMNYELY